MLYGKLALPFERFVINFLAEIIEGDTKMDKRQEIVYGILTGKVLLPFLIRGTRKEAISDFLKWSTNESWEEAKKNGYSVQKFRLVAQNSK